MASIEHLRALGDDAVAGHDRLHLPDLEVARRCRAATGSRGRRPASERRQHEQLADHGQVLLCIRAARIGARQQVSEQVLDGVDGAVDRARRPAPTGRCPRRATPARSRRPAPGRPCRRGRRAGRARRRVHACGPRARGRRVARSPVTADRARSRPRCPAARPWARRRRGRARRSRRAARRRGARRGCRSRSTRTPSGSRAPAQPVGHLDAEAVVAEEDVADAGHEHLHGARLVRHERLDLVGVEVEVAALPASMPRSPGRRRA